MNISLMRLKPLIRELAGIRLELARIADCKEAELAEHGINMRVPRADTSGPEPTVTFVDEEEDYVRESVARLKRQDEILSREEQE